MERHFESELRKLKDNLLMMGGYVEKAIGEAIEGLLKRQPERFDAVFELEKKINQAQVDVDSECLSLLARQALVARDLRTVVAAIKINSDLERMGDQAVNICLNAREYMQDAPLKPLIDIPRMADDARWMVREALNAVVTQDAELAQRVLEKDDDVDALKNQLFREIITYMTADVKAIKRGLDLILIARNLERIGDHATNIAEDVIFTVTGDDVRHNKGAAFASTVKDG
jgi:phosphate transport system protein